MIFDKDEYKANETTHLSDQPCPRSTFLSLSWDQTQVQCHAYGHTDGYNPRVCQPSIDRHQEKTDQHVYQRKKWHKTNDLQRRNGRLKCITHKNAYNVFRPQIYHTAQNRHEAERQRQQFKKIPRPFSIRSIDLFDDNREKDDLERKEYNSVKQRNQFGGNGKITNRFPAGKHSKQYNTDGNSNGACNSAEK